MDFEGTSLDQWLIFNCLDATVKTTRQPKTLTRPWLQQKCRVAAFDKTSNRADRGIADPMRNAVTGYNVEVHTTKADF